MSNYNNEPWNANFLKRSSHLTGNALRKRENNIRKKYINSQTTKNIANKKRRSKALKNYLLTTIKNDNYKYFDTMKLYDDLFDEFMVNIDYEISNNTKKFYFNKIPNRGKEDLKKYYDNRFRDFLRGSGYYQEANNNFRNSSNFNNSRNNSNNATQSMAATQSMVATQPMVVNKTNTDTQPTKKRRRLSGGRKKKKKSKRKIHKGPRGGKYYIKKGKKVYLKK